MFQSDTIIDLKTSHKGHCRVFRGGNCACGLDRATVRYCRTSYNASNNPTVKNLAAFEAAVYELFSYTTHYLDCNYYDSRTGDCNCWRAKTIVEFDASFKEVMDEALAKEKGEQQNGKQDFSSRQGSLHS